MIVKRIKGVIAMTKQEQFVFNKIDDYFFYAIKETRNPYPLNLSHYFLGSLEGWIAAWHVTGILTDGAYKYITRCIKVLTDELEISNQLEERMKKNVSDKEST